MNFDNPGKPSNYRTPRTLDDCVFHPWANAVERHTDTAARAGRHVLVALGVVLLVFAVVVVWSAAS